jgi:uncharacterized oligopeptide transporter (OPT) family protein
LGFGSSIYHQNITGDGAGIGVVVMQLISALKKRSNTSKARDERPPSTSEYHLAPRYTIFAKKGAVIAAPLISAGIVALIAWVLGLGLLPSVLLVLGTWITVLMSSQSVGVSGINPMEVFGILVVLIITVFCHDLSIMSLFFIAAIVAVASGLTGDIMNDFKAGKILGTNPRDQWIAQVAGGIMGALVASAVLLVLVNVFGTESFGVGKEFVAPQASVVAAMMGGIPHVGAFVLGIAVGLVLAAFKLPCMTLGLGVYLPFYLSLTAFVGGVAKLVYMRVRKKKKESAQTFGLAVASGLLGGESLVGVISALVIMFMSMGG